MRFCDLMIGDRFKFKFDQDMILIKTFNSNLYSYKKIGNNKTKTIECPPDRDCIGKEYDIRSAFREEVIVLDQ